MGCHPSWKDADARAAVQQFFSHGEPRRADIREIMRKVVSDDPFERRCAADLARRVSARRPGILREFAGVFVDLSFELPQEEWQARGYALLAAAENVATRKERMRLALAVRQMLRDERIAVRAMALEAFGILAIAEPELRAEALTLLEAARYDAAPAMRCRTRRMLPQVLAAEQGVVSH